MVSRRLLGSAFANAFLIVSLIVPSAALAVKQSEELAPGFSQCVKKAGSSEGALNGCLDAAQKYWDARLSEENKETMSCFRASLQDIVTTFHTAWLQYKKAGMELACAAGKDKPEISARTFSVKETKRQALLLKNSMFDGNKEELAPGYDLCQKRAESASCAAEFREIADGCLKSAKDYWEGVLSQQNNRYMKAWQDSPAKQQSVQNFQKAWTAYKEAGYDLIACGGGSMSSTNAEIFIVQETRRHAKELTSLGLH